MKVTINNAGTITIKVTAAALKKAAVNYPALEVDDEKSGRVLKPHIPDAKAFAKEVFSTIQIEEEDGTNPIHRLFDDAFLNLTESGPQSVLFPGDDGYKKRYAD